MRCLASESARLIRVVPAARFLKVAELIPFSRQMDRECRSSAARYGIILDASLITGIDPPQQIESALAAINTAHNEVSSDLSVAQALADQRIEESKRAVEIQTMKASPSPSFSIRSTNRELL